MGQVMGSVMYDMEAPGASSMIPRYIRDDKTALFGLGKERVMPAGKSSIIDLARATFVGEGVFLEGGGVAPRGTLHGRNVRKGGGTLDEGPIGAAQQNRRGVTTP
jgi:hypothetical protein